MDCRGCHAKCGERSLPDPFRVAAFLHSVSELMIKAL